MAAVVNINDLLDDHVSLDLECLDRIYLNAYIPNLQISGQVITFLRDHLGMPIASPAVMEKMGNRFRKAVDAFAEDHDIPIVHFKKGDRHIDVMTPYLEAATEPAVVAIGVAQEFQSVFAASRRDYGQRSTVVQLLQGRPTGQRLLLLRERRRLRSRLHQDLCVLPLSGQGLGQRARVGQAPGCSGAASTYCELSNGFASCSDPARLQAICDHLGPNQIQSFFERWMGVIPTPLEASDRLAGFWWELSMRQIEVSRTLVFDAPRRARAFFEAAVADNLDIGRPDEVKLIFSRQIRNNTKSEFATKVVTRGTEVTDQRLLQALAD